MDLERKELSYAKVGVDVAVEADAARILYEASKKTWANRAGKLGEIIVPFDDFSGLRFIRVDNLPKGTVLGAGSDGVATKAEIAEKANRFNTIALDLMAMVCDDAVIRGAEPILVKSVLTMNTLGRDKGRLRFIRELATGYVAAAKEAGVVVINGEIAQHNDRMGDLEKFKFDWSGDVTWFAHQSRLITGFAIQPGDQLVGFAESGFRCNGLSLLRFVLKNKYGGNWGDVVFDNQRLVDIALTPSKIYTRAVVDMTGGWDLTREARVRLNGLAHITGGGIPEKLGRLLRPSGLGARIYDPFLPNKLMLYCQELGITDFEAYRTWNMGQGMIVVTKESDQVIKIAKEHEIEAKVIGEITKKPGIVISSKGLEGGNLRFH